LQLGSAFRSSLLPASDTFVSYNSILLSFVSGANPTLQGFFEKLVKANKPRMQAIGACMRKLVMLCYGVLKNRQPFDPKWSSRIAS
jgi:hypothetical protein